MSIIFNRFVPNAPFLYPLFFALRLQRKDVQGTRLENRVLSNVTSVTENIIKIVFVSAILRE